MQTRNKKIIAPSLTTIWNPRIPSHRTKWSNRINDVKTTDKFSHRKKKLRYHEITKTMQSKPPPISNSKQQHKITSKNNHRNKHPAPSNKLTPEPQFFQMRKMDQRWRQQQQQQQQALFAHLLQSLRFVPPNGAMWMYNGGLGVTTTPAAQCCSRLARAI